ARATLRASVLSLLAALPISRRSRKFCGTVVSRLVLAAELGGGLPSGGVFGHDLLDLAVEAGGFELGVGLVEHVVVLLGEELPERSEERRVGKEGGAGWGRCP